MQDKLNYKLRKVLNHRTPFEVFFTEVTKALAAWLRWNYIGDIWAMGRRKVAKIKLAFFYEYGKCLLNAVKTLFIGGGSSGTRTAAGNSMV